MSKDDTRNLTPLDENQCRRCGWPIERVEPWSGFKAWLKDDAAKFAPLNRELIVAERAVLEAAEKWFKLNVMTGMPSEETVKIIEAKGVFVSAVDRAMAVAVARMLKAREPAPTVPAATDYNWHCRACGVVSKQTTAVPKEDRKCPCGAPCTLKARGGK